ncbi:MAG: plastocyanin/azurin family copper-binding protein [Dehalococcoidia bacterium]|nr:plastocyanin/azurin family copper-binding protein [Dehalococcoidia bacterium]
MSLRRTLSLLVVPLLAAGLGVAAGLSSASADDETITLQDISFNPSSVTINVGDTVTWSHNDEGLPHNVTSSGGGPLDSGNFEAGGTFQFTFTEPGTFGFMCTIHPSMTGSVTVQQQAEPTNTPAPDPTDTPVPDPTNTPAPDPTNTPAATPTSDDGGDGDDTATPGPTATDGTGTTPTAQRIPRCP